MHVTLAKGTSDTENDDVELRYATKYVAPGEKIDFEMGGTDSYCS